MKHRPKVAIISSILFLILAYGLRSQQNQQKSEDLVSLIKEKSGIEVRLEDVGWSWKEEDVKGNIESGEITFSDAKWLMYLIHWGPIQVPKITVDYVKERMLKMWGVNFEFTGKEGTTRVSGHDAAWAEAYGTNKSFYTRFIIWNCPESGREFIADTNYNLRRKTPKEDFEKEMLSARTVHCHPGVLIERPSELAKKYESDKYGFSFYYPEEWFIFDSPYSVPFPQYEGIRGKEMGSLLGLCSDENISVTLKWSPLEETKKEEMVMGVEQKSLENLTNEIQSRKEVESFENYGIEYFTVNNKKIARIWGECIFKEPENEQQKAFFSGRGIFQAAQWNLENMKKKIVVILLTRQYKSATQLSTPTRHLQDKFLRDLINRID
jgi:hypothetical protein